MRYRHIVFLMATIAITACKGGENSSNNEAITPTDTLTLRATSDMRTPSPVKAATFVPNSVASWLGHIILLDSRGGLHRATTDSAETEPVALGRYAGVTAIAREQKPGVFFALTEQGHIKAFIESDDDGNFSPLAISQSNQKYERFCNAAKPNNTAIWAVAAGTSYRLSVEIFDDSSASLSVMDKDSDAPDPCKARSGFELSENSLLRAATENSLTLTTEGTTLSVELTNGLSIAGMTPIGYVAGTQANMGSVFNEGLILAADKNEGRVVLVSRSYALKELEAR